MIRVCPFDDLSAVSVFRSLDPSDHMEAELVRGAPTPGIRLYADWSAMRGGCLRNDLITTVGGTPFAVLALANTGQAGVAQAALLARDHGQFRRHLAVLAARIRKEMPTWCLERGIHRVEARAWVDHPSACSFLAAIGFRAECDMPGFGQTGMIVFRQFAWLSPALTRAPSPPAMTRPA